MIESFSFGTIVIDGEEISHDLIIYPDRIDANWWRVKAHSLELEDLTEVFAFEPEVLIVGTGANGRMRFPDETQEHIKSGGIELFIADTGHACEVYNELKDKKKTVAVLHLTC
jgi:hypothetical protein